MFDLFLAVGLFLGAISVALLPSQRFGPRKPLWWTFERLQRRSSGRARAWAHGYHLIDFGRAWVAMGLVWLGVQVIGLRDEAMGFRILIAAQTLVAMIGTLAQLPCPERDNVLQAPLAYVAGLVFGIFPPLLALLAVGFGVASAFAFQLLPTFFVFAAGLLAALVVVLGHPKLLIVSAVLVAGSPAVAAFFLRRKFVVRFSTRAIRESRERGSRSSRRDDVP